MKYYLVPIEEVRTFDKNVNDFFILKYIIYINKIILWIVLLLRL